MGKNDPPAQQEGPEAVGPAWVVLPPQACSRCFSAICASVLFVP